MILAQLLSLLPDSFNDTPGTVRAKTAYFLKSVAIDLTTISHESQDIIGRLDRLAASAASLSILHTIFRTQARELENEWCGKNPKPTKEDKMTVKEYEALKDAASREARYTSDLILALHEDLIRKTSVLQTLLRVYSNVSGS